MTDSLSPAETTRLLAKMAETLSQKDRAQLSEYLGSLDGAERRIPRARVIVDQPVGAVRTRRVALPKRG
ncbi:hypothetical protein ASD97_26150 [Streptomyces sp. Root63]|nr:hypothetical protein ASD29_32450 [Streptomyces sp. Root1295]KRA34117.1 hypothetical protein ASD97_26150 [Streptomyces sp. Root63]